jgi:hypothetical protein
MTLQRIGKNFFFLLFLNFVIFMRLLIKKFFAYFFKASSHYDYEIMLPIDSVGAAIGKFF